MRRASVDLAKCYSKPDAGGAKKAYAAVQRSCRECHKAYGIEDE